MTDQDRAVPAVGCRPGPPPPQWCPPAGPPPAGTAPGALAATSCVEVQRLVNSAGIITLGNQVIQVGSPLAGQRARIRLDGTVMHVITQDSILWRTLPCPIPPGQRHRLQGVRLAGPDPLPQPDLTIQRKVSSRGGIQVARQRIQVGFTHAGQTVTIELADTTVRIIDQRRRADRHRAPQRHRRDQQVQGLRHPALTVTPAPGPQAYAGPSRRQRRSSSRCALRRSTLTPPRHRRSMAAVPGRPASLSGLRRRISTASNRPATGLVSRTRGSGRQCRTDCLRDLPAR